MDLESVIPFAPELDSRVLRFCREVVAGCNPCYVKVRPLSNKPINECFSIVPEHLRSKGGREVIGWNIWSLFQSRWLEAEFHAVWQNRHGALLDITPKEFPIGKILFVEDREARYEGRQVDNIRERVSDANIRKYCALAAERYAILNEGDLANEHGDITELLSDSAQSRFFEIENQMMQLHLRISSLSHQR